MQAEAASRPRSVMRVQWTGPEFELAARPDLTAAEVARMIGRTTKAVWHMRARLREEEPRAVYMAGQAR